MQKFIITNKEGYIYSKESGDKNKIHLDEITGYNSIFNFKIVHGTLIFLKFLKLIEKKIKKFNEYSIKIDFEKGFKYNFPIFLSKNSKKIFQENGGRAIIRFHEKKSLEFEKEKFRLTKIINIKKSVYYESNDYNSIRLILNYLSWYVGMIYPGKNSMIADINITFSLDFDSYKKLKIYSYKKKFYPIIRNKILYKNFIVEFTSLKKPELIVKNKKISKVVKDLVLNTKIPILLIGAGSGIGKEMLHVFRYNKKIPIIATYNVNKIHSLQKNIKAIKLNIRNDLNILKEICGKFDNLRIYYFATPKITITKNNKYNIKEFNKFYINYPKKLISIFKKKNYLEFFYPSTILIDEKNTSDYTISKTKAEKILKKKKNNNLKINILRVDKINTKQNLSFTIQKLPSFIEKLNKNPHYRKKIFFFG